jgi:hypothetical protein
MRSFHARSALTLSAARLANVEPDYQDDVRGLDGPVLLPSFIFAETHAPGWRSFKLQPGQSRYENA